MSEICVCGHDLYSHYMCGLPENSRCLFCGSAVCKRFRPDAKRRVTMPVSGPNAKPKADAASPNHEPAPSGGAKRSLK